MHRQLVSCGVHQLLQTHGARRSTCTSRSCGLLTVTCLRQVEVTRQILRNPSTESDTLTSTLLLSQTFSCRDTHPNESRVVFVLSPDVGCQAPPLAESKHLRMSPEKTSCASFPQMAIFDSARPRTRLYSQSLLQNRAFHDSREARGWQTRSAFGFYKTPSSPLSTATKKLVSEPHFVKRTRPTRIASRWVFDLSQ